MPEYLPQDYTRPVDTMPEGMVIPLLVAFIVIAWMILPMLLNFDFTDAILNVMGLYAIIRVIQHLRGKEFEVI